MTTLPSYLGLRGRKGLVLGLADERSIAFGVAREARAQGANIVTTCLNAKAQLAVAPLTQALDVLLLPCNVEDPQQLEATVAQVAEQLGGLDFVVHSIAWAPLTDLHGAVVDSSSQGFARAMDISCHSFASLAKLCAPHMRNGGSLVTMSYLGADEAVPHYGMMGPVKAALESMVRYMAAELGAQNIRVHAVSPGPMPTRAASGLVDFDGLMARTIETAPLRRLVTLDEVGGCVAFLVGPDATGMTGQTLFVDGGAHAVR